MNWGINRLYWGDFSQLTDKICQLSTQNETQKQQIEKYFFKLLFFLSKLL